LRLTWPSHPFVRTPTGPLLLSNRLVLQRHFERRPSEAAFVMAAAGLGLALPTPAGPMQAERGLGMIAQDDRQHAPHFRCGEGDQAALGPPLASV
jgi:hypothetical protein